MKNLFDRVKGYLADVKSEGRRVSWPGKHELFESTLVVISFIVILAVTTLVCDKAIQLFINLVHTGA